MPALVLGSGITALGVMRCLGAHSTPTFVVTDSPGCLRASRWFRPLGDRALTPGSTSVEDLLRGLDLPGAVLFPCSDETVLAVSALPADLAERFPASVPPLASTRSLVDKGELARLLAEAGIPHPCTARLRTPDDLDGLEDVISGGAFLKPVQSQAFFRAFHCKGFPVDDVASARRHLERALAQGFEMVLQELVPGPAANQVCVDGFVDR
ncbi:MAG TPA: hypothetical protein VFQ22_12180, partial [Longimicrobiales bacterium]|nr:hypothetical protein [Longimicrobiales bacterium]